MLKLPMPELPKQQQQQQLQAPPAAATPPEGHQSSPAPNGAARPKTGRGSEVHPGVSTVPQPNTATACHTPEARRTSQQSHGVAQPLHADTPAPESQSKPPGQGRDILRGRLKPPLEQSPIAEKPPSPREVVIIGMPTLDQISQTLDRVSLEKRIGELERDLNRERSMGRKKDDKLREKEGEVATLMQQVEKLDNEVNEYKV